jgi:DNA topoisomerase-1
LKKIDDEKNRVIAEYKEEEISVLNGRFGPYITQKGNNYKIPKGKEADSLTLDEIKEIIASQPQTVKSKFSKKKK